VVGGVPDILGAVFAACAATEPRARAEKEKTRAAARRHSPRADNEYIDMKLPIKEARKWRCARPFRRRSSHPHSYLPFRLTRSWSAIARMELADATELSCEAGRS
jgi:hypothetical protein